MTQAPALNSSASEVNMLHDEPTRIVTHFLTSIATRRIKEDLAPNCRLFWIKGMEKSTPTMINEFLRFHVCPQYTHVGFEDACKSSDRHTIHALQQRFRWLTEPMKKPRRTRDLNAAAINHAQLRNRAESFTEDDDDNVNNNDDNSQQSVAPQTPPAAVHASETQIASESTPLLQEAETMHIESTPPPSARKVYPTPTFEHEHNEHNSSAQSQLRYIEALGALHSTGPLAVREDGEETIIKVNLQLVYKLCPSTAVPEFVLIAYKRIDMLDKRDSLRINLSALMSAAADDDAVVVGGAVDTTAGDAGTIVSLLPKIGQTPPRSCTPTQTQRSSQLTPVSTAAAAASTSTGRKRKASASKDRNALQNRRKAMRRLRL